MKNNHTNLAHKSSILMITTVLLASCGGGDGGGSGDSSSKSSDPKVAAKSFGSQVLFKGGTTVNKKPPVPTATVNNSTVSGGTVKPGDNKTMNLDLSKVVTGLAPTNNITINIAFNNRGGGVGDVSRYTAINTTVGNLSNGIFRTDFQVPSQVCDNLADIQHQIDCYESVTLPDGQVISLSQGRQMLLACGNKNNQGNNQNGSQLISGTAHFCYYNTSENSCNEVNNTAAGSGFNLKFFEGTGSSTCNSIKNKAPNFTTNDLHLTAEDDDSSSDNIFGRIGTCVLFTD